jgi:hypothetical protein
MRRLAVVAFLILVAAACSSSSKSSSGSSEPYPAPPNPMELARKAGLVPETAEQLRYHVHAHLDYFIDGKKILVPGGIGIDIHNPGVHSGTVDGQPAYGGIDPPCDQPCISPLHTHDVTGVLHTESATRKDNTFGQFLIEWNVKLPADAVVYVNGKKFDGDPTTIDLADHTEISVVEGTAPGSIPSSYDFG